MATVVESSFTLKEKFNKLTMAGKIEMVSELLQMGLFSEIEIKIMLGLEVTPLEAALHGIELK